MPIARTFNYREKVEDVIRNAAAYHAAYYEAETFHGPSLYFHQRCVAMFGDEIADQRLEYIYATLASWGMHRMGKGGSKMLPFEDFRDSVLSSAPLIQQLRRRRFEDMNGGCWELLGDLFRGIRIMATRTTIVGNSKVMAHLVPNLVPPIDRQYTLMYLRGNKNIKNDLDAEWLMMKYLLENFFYRVATNPSFTDVAAEWASDPKRFPWDTSVLKIVDNLVIGAVKAQA